MSDRQAKTALTVMILLGAVLGGVWAWFQYRNLLDARSWNLVGLGVIATVSTYAFAWGLLALREKG
ncbi:MAG: hypothetical protein ACKOCB_02430 [Planctomycetia bacterium]